MLGEKQVKAKEASWTNISKSKNTDHIYIVVNIKVPLVYFRLVRVCTIFLYILTLKHSNSLTNDITPPNISFDATNLSLVERRINPYLGHFHLIDLKFNKLKRRYKKAGP